jgi:hypothetical protein
MFENSDLIHRYSRAEAIADGVLIDVSATAAQAGIRFPVALTRAVWERCVAGQDEQGHLCAVLWMLALSARCADGAEIRFAVHVSDSNSNRTPLVRLKAICGPGDEGEPVITVLLPDED